MGIFIVIGICSLITAALIPIGLILRHKYLSRPSGYAEERSFRRTSLTIQYFSMIATIVFAAASVSIAFMAFSYQSSANIMGNLSVWKLTELSNEKADCAKENNDFLQFTLEIYNAGGAATVMDQIVLDDDDGGRIVLASGSQACKDVNAIVDDSFQSFDSNRVLEPGALKRFRFHVANTSQSLIDQVWTSGCSVDCKDGKSWQIQTERYLTASDRVVNHLSLASES